MFAWLHEEVETNPDEISNALCFCVSADVLGEDVVQDGCWEWFDVLGWRVLCVRQGPVPRLGGIVPLWVF